VPRARAVGVADCPVEPKQGVPIASGDVFAGANCTLNLTTDIDSFVFTANSGDIWHFLVASNGDGAYGVDICLTLYNPSAAKVFSGCSNTFDGDSYAVMTDQTLTATGTYTIDVTEASNGTLNYGLSLERDYPTPPDAQGIQLTESVTGSLGPGEDSPAYTFPVVTTGTYQVSATIPNGVPYQSNLCMTVYLFTGASAGSACTNTFDGDSYTAQVTFTPSENGTSMVLLYQAGNANTGAVNYSMEASCLAGVCTPVYPPCTLKNAASYASGTLTMNFTVGNNVATTWNAWLTDQNTITNLFSLSQPITVPPVTISKTTALSPAGTVGVLSTLTTPTKGIFCSSYVQINTGKP